EAGSFWASGLPPNLMRDWSGADPDDDSEQEYQQEPQTTAAKATNAAALSFPPAASLLALRVGRGAARAGLSRGVPRLLRCGAAGAAVQEVRAARRALGDRQDVSRARLCPRVLRGARPVVQDALLRGLRATRLD